MKENVKKLKNYNNISIKRQLCLSEYSEQKCDIEIIIIMGPYFK